MPPSLDVYCLTRYRDLNTINTFLDLYVDRAASEDRGGEELIMLPLNSFTHPDKLEDCDWEPARTLSNVVQRGLDYPRRSFTIYLEPSQLDMDQITLSFTSDNQLILGLNIDDENDSPETMTRAEQLLKVLAEQFKCHLGLIMVESPPPVDEKEFVKVAGDPLTIMLRRFVR